MSGCASNQTFHVIDSKTGEPLGDVRVERLESAIKPSEIPFVMYDELSPVEKKTTNETGAVTFKTTGSKFMVNPSGDNPAFNKAYVKTTWSGATVIYPAEHREVSVTRRDGVVNVALERRWVDSSKLRREIASASSHEDNPVKPASAEVAEQGERSNAADTHSGN